MHFSTKKRTSEITIYSSSYIAIINYLVKINIGVGRVLPTLVSTGRDDHPMNANDHLSN